MTDNHPSRASRLFSRLDLQQQLNDLGFGRKQPVRVQMADSQKEDGNG